MLDPVIEAMYPDPGGSAEAKTAAVLVVEVASVETVVVVPAVEAVLEATDDEMRCSAQSF